MNNLTWHCEVILRNDEECTGVVDCFTTHVMNRVYHNYKGEAYTDQKPVRICVLAQYIRMYVEEITGSENENSFNQMIKELICGALQEIDFKEIAENLIGDYHQKSPAEVADSEEFFEAMGFRDYEVNED